MTGSKAATQYMGIHLNFITPYGNEMELQVHSPESFKVKQEGHIYYEGSRTVATPNRMKSFCPWIVDREPIIAQLMSLPSPMHPYDKETNEIVIRGEFFDLDRIIQRCLLFLL